ncbi:MAG: glycosyltransferase [Rhizobacter sp.]|nr:glycosyltransferase [Bacteriovorax sp.]
MNSSKIKYTISVLIPTWKRADKLTICLEHISLQSRAADEVIVVIRKEDEIALSIIERFKNKIPGLREVFTEKIGVIAAENAGLKNITNDLVAFIDDDGYAPIDWLEKIELFFVNHPSAAALGGPDIIMTEPWSYHDFPVHTAGKMSWYGKVTGNHHRKVLGETRVVDVLKGVNMTFKRGMFDLLDENLAGAEGHLGNGSQWELDLCMRVQKNNGIIYFDPSLLVTHDSNHSHHDYIKAAKNNTHNLSYVMLKNLTFPQNCIFILYALIVGNMQLPGLIKNINDLLKKPDFYTLQLINSKYSGFYGGIKTWLRLF